MDTKNIERRCDSMHVVYNEDEKIIRIKNDAGKEIIYHSSLDLDPEYDDTQYNFRIFFKNDIAENDSCMVYDKATKIRMGWMIPCQALFSREHEYADDQYFQKYAYVAIVNLLKFNFSKLCGCDNVEEKLIKLYTMDDLYKNDRSILIISKENTAQIKGFTLDEYIPYLFSYGYTCCDGALDISARELESKHINLKKISDEISDNFFVKELFESMWRNNLSSIVKFHLLYQIIEILIMKVFDNELKIIVNEIKEGDKNLFVLKNRISNITNENYRIEKLFNEYSKIQNEDKTELVGMCKKFLAASNNEIEQDDSNSKGLGKYIYKVRNLLFHSYHTIPANERGQINLINEKMLKIIIDVVVSYKNIM